MKLKYYLRGLGIGILVTALILIAAPREKEVLSDTEIRERALQLGMVDSSSLTLADMQENSGAEKKESAQEGAEATREREAVKETTEATVESQEVEETTEATGESQEEKKSPEIIKESDAEQENTVAAESSPTADYATIIIRSGANSYSVAKDLEAVGLITDAKSFDSYLCDYGYSRRISTGTYEIVFGTTEEEIAKIISGKR